MKRYECVVFKCLSNGIIMLVVMFDWNIFWEGGKELVRMLNLVVVEM